MRIPIKLIIETSIFVKGIQNQKMVHYREIHKEIDHTNFQISTMEVFLTKLALLNKPIKI